MGTSLAMLLPADIVALLVSCQGVAAEGGHSWGWDLSHLEYNYYQVVEPKCESTFGCSLLSATASQEALGLRLP